MFYSHKTRVPLCYNHTHICTSSHGARAQGSRGRRQSTSPVGSRDRNHPADPPLPCPAPSFELSSTCSIRYCSLLSTRPSFSLPQAVVQQSIRACVGLIALPSKCVTGPGSADGSPTEQSPCRRSSLCQVPLLCPTSDTKILQSTSQLSSHRYSALGSTGDME